MSGDERSGGDEPRRADAPEVTGDEPREDVATVDHGTIATARRVLAGIRENPTLAAREVNRLCHRRGHTWRYNRRGDDVVADDWDSLIVLDACRYDLFAELSTLPGTLGHRTSRGSNTIEFLIGNLDGRELFDTVYVTANPQFFRRRDEIDVRFHDVVNVWADGWDEEEGTVTPEVTTRIARRAAEQYPSKRLLVHYMQPHYPFVGSSLDAGDMLDERRPSVWDLALAGAIDPDEVWRAYANNLDRALPHVADLVERLAGKAVVTADHGNMAGERSRPLPAREWGHPVGIYTPELIRVPWLECPWDDRRRIVAEEPVEEGTGATRTIATERLADLGYVA